MSFFLGVTWSLAGACVHTGIDALRKLGSKRILPSELVALVAVLDAVIAMAFVGVFEGWQPLQLQHPRQFAGVVLCSSALLLLSKLLYQKALHASPLSLTVPYLSFTPAILVLVAYLLVGEVPTMWGTVGVCIVTLGGYLLSVRTAAAPVEALEQQPGSPSKTRPPPMLETVLIRSSPSIKLLADATAAKSVWALKFGRQLRAAYSSDMEKGLPDAEVLLAGTPKVCIDIDGDANGKLPTPRDRARPITPRNRPPTPNAASKAAQAAGGHGTGGLPALLQWWAAPPPSAGPFIVLTVAAIWSITASLDKIGLNLAPSIWVYFLCQRLVIGTACLTYLLLHSRPALAYMFSDFGLLVSISLLELAAVVCFLEAINNIFLSYVVAIKRINVLLSTVVGALLFKESVGSRIPYILIMLSGMLLIVLQPGHSSLHVTHRTV